MAKHYQGQRVCIDAGADAEIAGACGYVDELRKGERARSVEVLVAFDDGRAYWVKGGLVSGRPGEKPRKMAQQGLPMGGGLTPQTGFAFRPPSDVRGKAPAPRKPKAPKAAATSKVPAVAHEGALLSMAERTGALVDLGERTLANLRGAVKSGWDDKRHATHRELTGSLRKLAQPAPAAVAQWPGDVQEWNGVRGDIAGVAGMVPMSEAVPHVLQALKSAKLLQRKFQHPKRPKAASKPKAVPAPERPGATDDLVLRGTVGPDPAGGTVTGLFPQADGTFDALTGYETKSFKTAAGAGRWMAKRTARGKPGVADSIDAWVKRNTPRKASKARKALKPKATPKPRAPRKSIWQPLLDAAAAARSLVEKQYHSYPRTLLRSGQYRDDFRDVYEPNNREAQHEMIAQAQKVRALRSPSPGKNATDARRAELAAWRAYRDKLHDLMHEYARGLNTSKATHWAIHAGEVWGLPDVRGYVDAERGAAAAKRPPLSGSRMTWRALLSGWRKLRHWLVRVERQSEKAEKALDTMQMLAGSGPYGFPASSWKRNRKTVQTALSGKVKAIQPPTNWREGAEVYRLAWERWVREALASEDQAWRVVRVIPEQPSPGPEFRHIAEGDIRNRVIEHSGVSTSRLNLIIAEVDGMIEQAKGEAG